MSRPVLNGPYFVLPARDDAEQLADLDRQERRLDFMRGYTCGVVTAITVIITGFCALQWLS
ncbi:hypothetical protein JNB71_03645 [Rhizobium herbae]|uniref:Uncharacterized protein n=1 Tax=Rhizobium herbae TaxID=508661 RepID=A0ABS7H6G5_9HYPH|nr:hypothetical protein [Rhizobium herbae]MBW9062405.1 hypothetical protein [Rhizobium herbae]